MIWTDQAIETVRRMWKDGHSDSEIAREIGNVTRNAVIGKRNRLGMSRVDNPVPFRPLTRAKKPATFKKPILVAASFAKLEPPAEPIIVAEPEPIIIRDPVALIDLEPHHCRWPIGNPREVGFGFCGAGKLSNSAYCLQHFMRSKPKEGEPKDGALRKRLPPARDAA